MTAPLPDIDRQLVRGLIADQFPIWSHHPIIAVDSTGTDNAIFRLGDNMAVRLPKVAWAMHQPQREYDYLPMVGAHLALPVPVPIALGMPTSAYPCHWTICAWVDGETLSLADVIANPDLPDDLARLIADLAAIDPDGGPPSGKANGFRGSALITRDVSFRVALPKLTDLIDTGTAMACWQESLAAPTWRQSPQWVHGDLMPGNLLFRNGRLCGTIDFGMMGVGDPACDAMAAWTCLSADARPRFRERSGADEAMWLRARGWALSVAVIALAAYRDDNPPLASLFTRTICEILDP
jgi:aminoglycoside phosphotransferase (APT) family kinase protein